MVGHRKPQTVVVTGAGAGVGRATALRFAVEGARVGLIARDATALADVRQEIENLGAVAAMQAVDVSDADAVAGAAAHFEDVLGPIDLWVNDAMLTVFSPVYRLTAAEFRRVTEVTYLGAVHGTMAALGPMRSRGRGHIINIGSALAYRGVPLQSAYCGAKHAIRGFTAALRAEMAHDRSDIGISIVELPAMNTPQFDWARTHMSEQPRPMGTVYQPEAAAEAVFRAAMHRPREYWVGFSTLMTIVGNIVAPGFMDRYLGRNAVRGQQTGTAVRPDRRDNLMAPVTDLHRVRGSFDGEAKNKAVILSGTVMRYAVVTFGAVLFLGLGILIGILL